MKTDGYRHVQLASGKYLAVHVSYPDWFDPIIAESYLPAEAAVRVRQELERRAAL